MRVLAGDIGGTNARLALFRAEPDEAARPRTVREATYASAELAGPAELLRRFLGAEEDERPDAACLAVAGPVTGEAYHLPNLGWEIREDELAGALGMDRLRVVNDFDAVGHGLAVLRADELEVLQAGEPRERAPLAVLGAGTGLGMAYLTWHDGRYRVHASEGGHAAFAPGDPIQCDLRAWLGDRYGRASRERVVSGPGLVAAYGFLRERREAPERASVRREIEAGDAARIISSHALAGTDALCGRALDLFVACYGAVAGDLALTLQAEGGLFVAGGIAPAILPALREGRFLEAFRAKGRLSDFMARIPVKVILNTDVGLLGAAVVAARRA